MSEEPVRIEPGDLESFLGDISDTGSDLTDISSPVYTNITEEDIPGYMSESPDGRTRPIDESLFGDITTPIGDGICATCGAPTFRPPGLTKTGRQKRAPKYCDLHTPHASVPQDGPNAQRLESQLRRVQEELADDWRLIGAGLGILYPVTGFYMFDSADPFTIAILQVFKNNARAMRVMHRMASIAPGYEIMKTAGGLFYSFQVDRQQADPHSTMSKRLGVERAFNAVYGSESPSDNSTVSNNGFAPPPHYATVQ